MTTRRRARPPERIAAGEFKARCLELMDDVAATGRTIVITKRGAAVARLAPVVERAETLYGFFGGEIEIEGDIVGALDVEWHALR